MMAQRQPWDIPMPPIPLTANEVIDRYFLEVRAKLLEVAATLDRIERAADPEQVADDRLAKVRRALTILAQTGTDRAEQIQLLFSRDYDAGWLDRFIADRSADVCT